MNGNGSRAADTEHSRSLLKVWFGTCRENLAEVKDLDSDTRKAYLKEFQMAWMGMPIWKIVGAGLKPAPAV